MTTVDDFEVARQVAELLKGLDSERQVRVLRWVSESLGIAQSSPARRETTAAASTSEVRAGGSADIKSFIAAKDPKSDNQFAAAVAYFYRFEAPQNERRDSITSEMLQEATRLAGRNRLGDPGKTLRNAKDMGYLDVSDRGEFKINSVGENLVAMTLPSQGRAATARPAKRQPRSKK
jgi:hypothetical protein